jgi:hypothetical protein
MLLLSCFLFENAIFRSLKYFFFSFTDNFSFAARRIVQPSSSRSGQTDFIEYKSFILLIYFDVLSLVFALVC